ncbi:MAG: hemolysin family protein [Dehalococcoidia bacterium]
MEIYLILLLALLLLSGFFSSAETAFLSLRRMQLEHAVREGEPGAQRVATLLASPARLLSAILVGNNLVNTAAAAAGTAAATALVGGGAGVALATAVVTVLLVVLGEVVPKTVALQHGYALAKVYSLPMRAWIVVTRPIVGVLDLVSRAMLRPLGARAGERQSMSLGELRTSILVGQEAGTLRREQSEMLLGALALQHTPVRQLMVPRVDIIASEATEPIRTAAERLAAAGFQRLPVYGENLDEVLGFAHISDVALALIRGRGDEPVASILRPVAFEPDTAPASAVLERMQASSSHLVILIDEHGATAGLVTLEDLLEEVVGEIRSESGAEAWRMQERGQRVIVQGRLRLGELSEQLGVDMDYPGAETVAGLVLAKLGRIPRQGEMVEHHGFRFTVLAADRRRVNLVAIEREAAVPPTEAP